MWMCLVSSEEWNGISLAYLPAGRAVTAHAQPGIRCLCQPTLTVPAQPALTASPERSDWARSCQSDCLARLDRVKLRWTRSGRLDISWPDAESERLLQQAPCLYIAVWGGGGELHTLC
jgi:hypothetical protein